MITNENNDYDIPDEMLNKFDEVASNEISDVNGDENEELQRQHQKIVEDAENKIKETIEKNLKKPNILICGYTGVGKSTLINSLLGSKAKIGTGTPVSKEFKEYEDRNLCIWDSEGMELNQKIEEFVIGVKDFVRKKQDLPCVENHIHIAIYAISASNARVQDADINIIKALQEKVKSLFIVLTKCDIATQPQIDAIKKILTDKYPKIKVYCTSDPKSDFVKDSERKAVQCRKWLSELIDALIESVPEAYKHAIEMAQIVDIERKINAIKEIKTTSARVAIITASVAAGGIGAAPIPGSDAPLLVGVQCTMILALAKLYGVDYLSKSNLIKQLTPLLGKALATSLLKFIPGAGSVVCASVALAVTGGLGYFTMNEFENEAVEKAKGNITLSKGNIFDNIPGYINLIKIFKNKGGN